MIRSTLLGALALVAAASAQPVTVYTNANIITVNVDQPRAEAMATAGERIVAVGTEEEVRRAARERDPEGTARVVDLKGRWVIPGLTDCHGHMANLGAFGLGVLELSGAKSFEEVVARVRGAAEERAKGEWVLGGRWDHESWPSKELPSHAALSEATPEHPVWLRRVDGHAALANRRAMELAGITRDTKSPAGGEIVRDAAGEPTGVFVDNAMALVQTVIPAGARGQPEELVLKAQEMCLAAGLTSVHDAGVSPGEIALYQKLQREGKLKLRIYAMVSAPHALKWFDASAPIVAGTGERLTVRAAKLYMDGAMGSRGAWLLEPYSDRPTGSDGQPWTGLAVADPAFVEAVARHALEKEYQVCAHAIGDRANREVLDAYARAISAKYAGTGRNEESRNHRFRVEHAQLLSVEDIPRFGQWGVIASMQPTHCTSDMRWVEARVGERRADGAYAWVSLLTSGAVVAGGSDFPVESHNPFVGLYAAVTRQTPEGQPEGGWRPIQRMMRMDAIYAFTKSAAYAAFEEHDRGTLEPGKLADFVVIDRDIHRCEPKEILGTRVLRTVIGGETVFEAPE